jgi:endonuclease/exonuclease/phosphatase family metal-dependent hydrolase
MASRLKQLFKLRNLLNVAFGLGALVLLLAYLSPFIHPETIPVIPLFGLAYPIILIYVACCLIISFFLKSRWRLILGVILLFGFNHHSRLLAFGFEDTPDEGQKTIKLVSYNVRLFDRYNPIVGECYRTKNKIFDYLKNENPDIVCFQEFYHQDHPTSFVTRDSLAKLLDSKDYHERYKHRLWGRQNFGVCMLSKYPIIQKGDIIFDNAHKSNNYCIYSDIVVDKDTIRVYNVHLQSIHFQQDDYALFNVDDPTANDNNSGAKKLLGKIMDAYPIRAKQAELVAKHIAKSPYPVLLCGDFNDTPLSYSYNQFNKLLVDAFRNSSKGVGSTYAGRIPAGRIDFIFHSESFGSYDFKIQSERLSDHYGISCKVFLDD